jgi:hypothetical protein
MASRLGVAIGGADAIQADADSVGATDAAQWLPWSAAAAADVNNSAVMLAANCRGSHGWFLNMSLLLTRLTQSIRA